MPDLLVVDDADAYAVYSAVLPTRFSSGDDLQLPLALLAVTVARDDCLPEEEDWQPVIEDYRVKNTHSRRLESRLDLPVPYPIDFIH